MEQFIIYRRLLFFCRPWWRYVLGASVLTLILAILQLPVPFFLKYAIDVIFPHHDYKLLNIFLLILLILLCIKVLFNYINNLILFLFRSKAICQIQYKLFEHMEYLNMTFYNNKQTGYLVSRLSSDTMNLQGLMADSLLTFTKNMLTFIIGVGALLFLHWKLALLALSIMPFFIYFTHTFSNKIRQYSTKVQEKSALVYNVFFETFYSIPIIKSFCLEQYQATRTRNKLQQSLKAMLNLRKTIILSTSISSFIGGLGPLLILWLGGQEIMNGHLSLGSFIAFNSFLGYLYSPVQNIIGLNTSIQTSLASLKRIFEIFDTPKENVYLSNFKNPLELNTDIKSIVFKNVNFSYNGNKPVLSNISFAIQKNEKIAFVGKSGAGKTTLINLLLKFYLPQEGSIYINDVDIRKIELKSLRKQIGVVLQNPYIFSGSIKDNIVIGKPSASTSEIVEAVKIANLYDYIMSLPDRFNTQVGERGIKLSAGEQQRLAIARVILKDPPLIVFDEATCQIDSNVEKLIHESMKKILIGKTAIFIAHRLFSLRQADKIIFIEDGKILKIGSHKELLKTLPAYQKLYDEQFKEL